MPAAIPDGMTTGQYSGESECIAHHVRLHSPTLVGMAALLVLLAALIVIALLLGSLSALLLLLAMIAVLALLLLTALLVFLLAHDRLL